MTAYATAAEWAHFLRPVALAVRNPPTASDMAGRAGALAYVLRVAPASLTEARQRDLCRTCEFWPSIAEIEKLFAAQWRAEAASRAITGGAANALPAPPSQPLDVVASVQNFRAIADQRQLPRDTDPTRQREPVTPRYLRPDQLRQAYAKTDTPAAQFRAEQLTPKPVYP